MNKKELVNIMAEKSQLNKKDAESALKAMLEAVSESLEKGESVQLIGFGTFAAKEVKERKGRNPRTGEEFTIEKSVRPVFKAGKPLKERVNKA